MNWACMNTCNIITLQNEGQPGPSWKVVSKRKRYNKILPQQSEVGEIVQCSRVENSMMPVNISFPPSLPSFISCVCPHQDRTDCRGLYTAEAALCRPTVFWNQDQTPQVSTCWMDVKVLWWGYYPIYVDVSCEWWKAYIILLMKDTLIS